TQANADQVVDWARRGRFGSVLLLHGTWGDYRHGYAVPTRYFPDGIAGLKQVVDKFHAAGVLVGAHCFATKLPKNADRMHPVPDKRLYQDLTTALAEPLEAGTTDIVVSDELTAWPRTTGTRDLLIGDELVIYESCSDGPPWTFRNCQRGAYGTTAASHPRAARVGRLFTDEARNIWVIDPRTTLLEEHAADLAATYNAAGFDWIYFDGAEDVPPPYWLNVSLAKLAVLNKLARPPVTVESAAHGTFCWHLDTRTGQRDYFWVSPSPKDEADDALLTSVPSARRQFMVPNIGWFPISNGRRGRTPLDDVEYVFGKAAATDSVVSVLTSVGELGSHPHLDALLDLIGRYERLRLERRLDEPTRQLLLRENREAMLVVDEAGNEQVVKAREMPFVAGDGRAVRCLMADPVAGVRTCSLFNVDQPVALDLSLDPRRVSFVDHRGEPVTVEQRPGARLVVPVRSRVLMKCRGIAGGEINMALRGARVTPLPMEAIWLRAGEAVDLQPGLTLVEPGLGADVFGRLLAATAPGPNGPTASASYHLSLPRAGTYRLYARIMSADTSSNSFWLTPPGGEPLVLGNVMTDYGSWVWAPPLELTLPAGPVVLKIGNRESQAGRSPLLSLLCLVPATSGEVPDDRQARIALTP
ncbi:MAG: hypothetical protein HUU35_10320, partial [Armatimonadetes bacterium]|nr:hypothetical protein [Armatimonadota bacterium]